MCLVDFFVCIYSIRIYDTENTQQERKTHNWSHQKYTYVVPKSIPIAPSYSADISTIDYKLTKEKRERKELICSLPCSDCYTEKNFKWSDQVKRVTQFAFGVLLSIWHLLLAS